MSGCNAALIREGEALLQGSLSPHVKRGRLRLELSRELGALDHVGVAGLGMVLDGLRVVLDDGTATIGDVLTAAAARVHLDRRLH